MDIRFVVITKMQVEEGKRRKPIGWVWCQALHAWIHPDWFERVWSGEIRPQA